MNSLESPEELGRLPALFSADLPDMDLPRTEHAREASSKMRSAAISFVRLRVFFLVALFSAMFFSVTHGSLAQMIGMSTEELAKASSLVVLGDVEDVQSFWSDDRRRIVSRATVLVQQVIRGKTIERRITVEYPGGEIDGLGMKVSDVAPMEKGERVLVFLTDHRVRKAGSVREFIGKAQGKYSISSDGIARKKGFSVASRGDLVDHELPLDDIIRKIKSVDDKQDKN